MAGVHRRRGRLSKEGRRLLGGAALLAVFAPVTAYTLNAAIAHVQSCGTEVDLQVAAAPEMAAVLDEFIAAGGGAPSRGSDVCADITVVPVAGDDVGDAGADVWIPETGLWRNLPGTGLAAEWEVLQESTASSAVGLALPEGQSTDQVLPDETDVSLQDPRQHAASLMWIIVFGVDEHTVEGGDGLSVMSAPEVAAHNGAGGETLQAPAGAAQVAQFEYPMLVRAGLGEDEREAAQNLLRSYGSTMYGEILARHGLTPGLPQTAPSSPDVIAAALRSWDER
ncbi:hypothetical protein [Glycomyces terrestris]|uniref:ABC transporter substrate-binding protein n=1 Tax=Glycomyces terrestris TaxID=2493553 RepID=A0A426UYD1_9ACTN|nr:hypothetical protein [Glycomyces terrestris]RRR99582.1 hypothetical protein EIW28_12870 [Glycomyces terrestris]